MKKAKARKKKTRVAMTRDEITFETLQRPMAQEEFGNLLGVPQQTVSKLVRYEVFTPGASAVTWCRQYHRFMMGQIFARKGWLGLAEAMGRVGRETEDARSWR